jgi:hypothetical protein
MSRFSFLTALAISLFCSATHVVAEPIVFSIGFDVDAPAQGNGSKVFGAHFDLSLQWDASSLTPTSNSSGAFGGTWATSWPLSNTTGSVTISGTASSDGVYPISEFSGSWRLVDDASGVADSVQFPTMSFLLDGTIAGMLNLRTNLRKDFFPMPPGILHPQPYSQLDVLVNNAPEVIVEARRMTSRNMTSSAMSIPEPVCESLAWLASLRIILCRRRVAQRAESAGRP